MLPKKTDIGKSIEKTYIRLVTHNYQIFNFHYICLVQMTQNNLHNIIC